MLGKRQNTGNSNIASPKEAMTKMTKLMDKNLTTQRIAMNSNGENISNAVFFGGTFVALCGLVTCAAALGGDLLSGVDGLWHIGALPIPAKAGCAAGLSVAIPIVGGVHYGSYEGVLPMIALTALVTIPAATLLDSGFVAPAALVAAVAGIGTCIASRVL